MSSERRLWLGRATLVCIATTLLLAGSVRSWQLAISHLLALFTLIAALRLPDAVVERAGPMHRLMLAGACLMAAVATGLLPVPQAVAAWVSPGLVAARPSAQWMTLSLSPVATLHALFTGSLALSIMAAAALWSSQRGGRTGAARAAVMGLAALVFIASTHAFTGATSLFGFIPLNYVPEQFFAPLVNPNHFATVLLLLIPVAIGEASRYRRHTYGVAAGVIAALAICLFLAVGSGGGFAAAALVGSVAAVRAMPSLATRGLMMVGAVAALVAGAWGWMQAAGSLRVSQSLTPRITQYSDKPGLFRSFWLTGSGAGTYDMAYRPVRSILNFRAFTHAHSEPLQWLVETGVVGLVAAGAAVVLVPRVLALNRAKWWGLGLLGVALHALVDFAPHIPGVLLLIAAAIGVHRGGFAKPSSANGSVVRGWLRGLVVFQVLAIVWHVHSTLVDVYIPETEAVMDDPDRARIAAQRLSWIAPWRPEPAIAMAWLAPTDERADRAEALVTRFESDPDTLRRAGSLFLSIGEVDAAVSALTRATERDVADYRAYVLLARAIRQRDPEASAAVWADAIVRWPWSNAHSGRPLAEGYDAFPIGVYWVDALDGATAPWLTSLAKLLHARGDDAAALLAYERAATKNEAYRWVPDRAQALAALGEDAAAEEWLDTVRPHVQDNPNYFWVRGGLMQQWGRPEEAIEAYLGAYARFPQYKKSATFAVRAAADVSSERVVSLGLELQAINRLPADAAQDAARHALMLRRFTVCVSFLQSGYGSTTGVSDEVRGLWAQCAAECEGCAVLEP